MNQKECVVEALASLGGMATLFDLYHKTDVSTWGSKTPFASIRRIVQTNKEFYKIRVGLWGLCDFRDKNLVKTGDGKSEENEKFTHSYFQGVIVEIGNLRHFQTFIPAQDKNKIYKSDKKLCELASLSEIYKFSYEDIVRRAKTIDTIWFNERNLPNSFYEVKHSTDFKNSLNKFYELQDFNARMFIVADKKRQREYEGVLRASIYEQIAQKVKFASYEDISRQLERESEQAFIKMGI